MVGFVADDLEEGVVTLASKPITKCTMMYPLPGFVPTAQAEATMLRGAKLIAGALVKLALYLRYDTTCDCAGRRGVEGGGGGEFF